MEPLDAQFDYEAYYRKHKSRAWVMPVVIGSAVILILIFVTFAFIQKTEADKARRSAEEMTVLANQQRSNASANNGAMAERIRDLEKQLKECSSK